MILKKYFKTFSCKFKKRQHKSFEKSTLQIKKEKSGNAECYETTIYK